VQRLANNNNWINIKNDGDITTKFIWLGNSIIRIKNVNSFNVVIAFNNFLTISTIEILLKYGIFFLTFQMIRHLDQKIS
jgi:hypothetical protein